MNQLFEHRTTPSLTSSLMGNDKGPKDNHVRVAVMMSGGVEKLAARYRELGIKKAEAPTIRQWIRLRTVRHVSFEKVYWLHKFSHMSYFLLTGVGVEDEDDA